MVVELFAHEEKVRQLRESLSQTRDLANVLLATLPSDAGPGARITLDDSFLDKLGEDLKRVADGLTELTKRLRNVDDPVH